jgi:MFS transporter, DHA3 family, multidrug efflux protein
MIGSIAQLIFIPFMTIGSGVDLIGSWFGTGADRGIAFLFTVTGLIGLMVTLTAIRSQQYQKLSANYQKYLLTAHEM